ncbi:MAG: hypothetical protein OEL75_02220, partial [Kiritimatiellaceae bacterium]|nr:hypothetical protein [Kiritimatiellaceae bacterium]
MAKFPSDSKFYLDDDAVVRSDRIHEPRKSRIQHLNTQINQEWDDKSYDKLEELLNEYIQLAGALTGEFLVYQKHLPALKFIEGLERVKQAVISDCQEQKYSAALEVIKSAELSFNGHASPKERPQLDELVADIQLLRDQAIIGWAKERRDAITQMIEKGDEASLAQAREAISQLQSMPFDDHSVRELLQDELQQQLGSAENQYKLTLVATALKEKQWGRAKELSEEVLSLDADNAEAKAGLAAVKRAFKRRYLYGFAMLAFI